MDSRFIELEENRDVCVPAESDIPTLCRREHDRESAVSGEAAHALSLSHTHTNTAAIQSVWALQLFPGSLNRASVDSHLTLNLKNEAFQNGSRKLRRNTA